MSDLVHTAVLNWLKATADDAMGMDRGDRHMANEAKKHIEFQDKCIKELEAEVERLTAVYEAARVVCPEVNGVPAYLPNDAHWRAEKRLREALAAVEEKNNESNQD